MGVCGVCVVLCVVFVEGDDGVDDEFLGVVCEFVFDWG